MRFRFGVTFKDGKLRVSRKTDAVPEPEPAKHDHTLDFSDTQWKVDDRAKACIVAEYNKAQARIAAEYNKAQARVQANIAKMFEQDQQIQQLQQFGQHQQFALQIQQQAQSQAQLGLQLQQRGLPPPSIAAITTSAQVLEQETQDGCKRTVEKVCFFLSHHFGVEMTATEKNEFWRIGSEHGVEYSISANRLAAASRSWQSRAQLYSDLLNGHHDIEPKKPAKPVIAPRQAAARWKPPKIRSEGS